MVKTITGKADFIESLRGKTATFLLGLSNTATANIVGITQAGIPGMIHLTPTLDAEFINVGEVRSLENIAQTPKGVPTPALITRAVHTLKPFRNIELLNLGLRVEPQLDYIKMEDLGISPSKSISAGAGIDAFELFQKGVDFAQKYNPDSDYVILAESVPSGTTTAKACALALGYDVQEKFSSSFKDVPENIRETTIKKALENIKEEEGLFEKLGKVADNMLIFNAGFILGANQKDLKIVLAGGTQMASVLLIVNSILKEMQGTIDSSKIALCTTKWIVSDRNSDIKGILDLLDFELNSYYSDFDFSYSNHPALKLYDNGEAKEGVGAGAALAYAFLNGIEKETVTKRIESFL